jgi:hypothetical protein
MTDEQMLKEIIERRRQWGETRGSDFDWLMNHIEKQQKEIKLLQKRRDEAIGEAGQLWTKIYRAKEALK